MNGSVCTHTMYIHTHTCLHTRMHTHTHTCVHARAHTHTHTLTVHARKKDGAREQQKDAHFSYELLGHCRLYQAVSKSQSVSVKTFLF